MQNFHFSKTSKSGFIIGLLSLFTLVGCGGPKGPAVTAVSGTVMLDGEPLDGASVVFHPTSSSGLAGSGKTSADGTFGHESQRVPSPLLPHLSSLRNPPHLRLPRRCPELALLLQVLTAATRSAVAFGLKRA